MLRGFERLHPGFVQGEALSFGEGNGGAVAGVFSGLDEVLFFGGGGAGVFPMEVGGIEFLDLFLPGGLDFLG